MKCWNCGHKTMFPWESYGKGWFKCSDCGATWTKMQEFTVIPISIERLSKGSKYTKYKARVIRRRRVKK